MAHLTREEVLQSGEVSDEYRKVAKARPALFLFPIANLFFDLFSSLMQARLFANFHIPFTFLICLRVGQLFPYFM